jgi:SpoVK/Ycf46/Vps4 family AAA+-type ATPase
VTLLLNGVPGTGKTLAARALAGELGRPLRVVLSSTVLSRYVGEAERNLEEHFKAAAGEGAVLFFDECEALLRSRNEALASRHDVSLVGTLLGLLDRHSGVVVFATNHAELVDAAFLRRMLFVATLHAPDQRLRRQLWERALAGVPGLRVETAAGRLMAWPLTGAQISDAVLRAALRAESQGRTVTVADLELAVTDCAAMAQANGQLGGVGEA